jgi:CheY-like chemotaxis protein
MSNSRKILLVDTESANRAAVEQVLSGKGFAVTTASSGEEALWKLSGGSYDAVFIEAVMRGMSGLDVAEELYARNQRVPVIVIAGTGYDLAKEGATPVGVAEFLHQPLSPEQIADTADRVLRMTCADPRQQAQPAGTETALAPTESKSIRRAKNIFLFLLAPFVGLVYLLAFPAVGVGMLAWGALKGAKQKSENSGGLYPATPAKRNLLKTIAMVPAALLIGIAFAIAGPIMGIGVLLWLSFEAWGKVGAKAMSA